MHSHEAQSRDIEYVPEHRMCVELERLVDFMPSFFSVLLPGMPNTTLHTAGSRTLRSDLLCQDGNVCSLFSKRDIKICWAVSRYLVRHEIEEVGYCNTHFPIDRVTNICRFR